MDKQLEKYIKDYIIEEYYHDNYNHDNIEIVSISKHDNLFIEILYNKEIEDGKKSFIITLTCTITINELNEYISLRRNEKLNSILHV